ncbi:MAG: MFS transporter [Candidatus Thorarchaeota archaeon]|nr:MFS transporter [Candidatus Thorarchaeota archaeon]
MTYEDENESVRKDEVGASDADQGAKMRWLYVLAIGLGFFTTGVSWSVYNSYLPADFLPTFISGSLENTIIGAIMVLDNILALFLQPYIGARSDKTRTRWGRRMPYILVGTPIAAIYFSLIAYGWAASMFWVMFGMITIFNVAMAFYRAPVVALMPDLVASEHRSKANGVINLMGGIGAIYAFAVASQIYKIRDSNLANLFRVQPWQIGPILAFLTTSVIMIIAVIILFVVIKEEKLPKEEEDEKEDEIGILEAMRQVSFSEDKSAIAVLGAIFFWFLGYNAIETWFTKYGKEVLGFATADASFLLNGIALAFVIFAVPAGFMAGRIGRKKTILGGLVIMLAALATLWVVSDYYTILGILAVAGVGWAMVNVNSIVIVWQLLGQKRLGAGTGLYYFASMSAAICGPFLTGVIFDLTSISLMYPVSIAFFIVALVLTLAIRTGEVGDQAIGSS